jgi:cobalt-precorrin-5B (C1)-methyltransferase
MLTHQIAVSEVSIELPGGNSARFSLSGQIYSREQASCFVIKDAGDDPDITNGAEIHATIRRDLDIPDAPGQITIEGGEGIGRVTKPGLAVPPGHWAINPVPLKMIETSVCTVVSPKLRYTVTVSIPDGEERSKKTLNARLGIIGGLSILGTTGIVRPISTKAWTDTLDAALDVAKACGCQSVVLSTGRTSELAVQNFQRIKTQGARTQSTLFDSNEQNGLYDLSHPEEAYIMMGDHVGYAVRACQIRGFKKPIIACQFAKLLKIACGHENTHAAASDLDLSRLLEWARNAHISSTITDSIVNANTAREIAIACSFNPELLRIVFKHARDAVFIHASDLTPHFLLADYNGNCISECV